MITSSSQRSTVKSGSCTLQNRRSVKLLDYSSGISGYYADFHEGHGTVGARHGRGMLCVNRPLDASVLALHKEVANYYAHKCYHLQ